MSISKNNIALFYIAVFFTAINITIGNEYALRYGEIYFSIIFLLIIVSLFQTDKRRRIYYLFSPSFLAVVYVLLSSILGIIVIRNEFTWHQHLIEFVNRSENFHLINSAIGFSTCAAYFFNVDVINKINFRPKILRENKGIKLAILMLVLFSIIPFDLSFLGASGDLSYPIKLLSVFYVTVNTLDKPLKWKVYLYLIITLLIFSSSYESKREIAFILLTIIVPNVFYYRPKLEVSLKVIGVSTILSSVFIIFILASSIARGYGDFPVQSILESFNYIDDYVQNKQFWEFAAMNFEVVTVYGNGANSIDLYLENIIETKYGSTFLKALFVIIPSSIGITKPDSMIEIYTSNVASSFWNEGGSMPIILNSEFIINFGFLFGIIGYVLLIRIFNYAYIYLAKNYHSRTFEFYVIGVTYFMFLMFQRGSGLDLLTLYVIVTLPFAIILKSHLKIKAM